MRRCFHRNHLLPIILLGLFLLLNSAQTAQANDIVFQLNNQGLTILSDNQFRLGPVTLFLNPWLFTELEQNETTFGLKTGGFDLGIGQFHLTIGRQLNAFGPGRYTFPLLAPLGKGITAEGLDQVAYAFSTKRLAYKKLYAWVPMDDEFRILLGQRATYDLGSFTFGFAETALAKERLPDFYYWPLPLVPVAVYQLVDDHYLHSPGREQALKIWGEIDLTLRLGPNFKLYGGYLIDERPTHLAGGYGIKQGRKINRRPQTLESGLPGRRRMEPAARSGLSLYRMSTSTPIRMKILFHSP